MADNDQLTPTPGAPAGFPRIEPPSGERRARGEMAPDEPPLDTPETTETYPIDEPLLEVREDSTLPEDEQQWPEVDTDWTAVDLEPPPPPTDTHYNPTLNPETPQDKELGLFEHLSELRSRLLKCVFAVFIATIVTWNYTAPIQEWFAAPIVKVLKNVGGELISTHPTGFFTIKFQFCLISAVILVIPIIIYQAWRFVEPALTRSERRYGLVLVPFSTLLFALGMGLGYVMSPYFYLFFLSFQPPEVAAKWDYLESVVLMAKMLLIFGITFQVPVVTIFLNKVGILSRNVLIEYWRHAFVFIFVVVAVLTPTWDPVSLFACAGPPCLLYLLSIWIIKWL